MRMNMPEYVAVTGQYGKKIKMEYMSMEPLVIGNLIIATIAIMNIMVHIINILKIKKN